MTLYNIIATRHAFTQNGINTMVFNHTIQTNLKNCTRWIALMNETHGFTNHRETFKNENESFIVYEAQFTTKDGERGWIEYEVWKEDIDM